MTGATKLQIFGVILQLLGLAEIALAQGWEGGWRTRLAALRPGWLLLIAGDVLVWQWVR